MLIISRQLTKNHQNEEVDEKQILLFIKSAIAMPFFLFKKEKQKKIVFAFVFVLLLNQQWECRFQYKI